MGEPALTIEQQIRATVARAQLRLVRFDVPGEGFLHHGPSHCKRRHLAMEMSFFVTSVDVYALAACPSCGYWGVHWYKAKRNALWVKALWQPVAPSAQDADEWPNLHIIRHELRRQV